MASPDAQHRWTQIFTLLDANGSGTIEKMDANSGIQVYEGSRRRRGREERGERTRARKRVREERRGDGREEIYGNPHFF
jgi:ribosomal protein S13